MKFTNKAKTIISKIFGSNNNRKRTSRVHNRNNAVRIISTLSSVAIMIIAVCLFTHVLHSNDVVGSVENIPSTTYDSMTTDDVTTYSTTTTKVTSTTTTTSSNVTTTTTSTNVSKSTETTTVPTKSKIVVTTTSVEVYTENMLVETTTIFEKPTKEISTETTETSSDVSVENTTVESTTVNNETNTSNSEQTSDPNKTLIGTMHITGYTPTGNPTASGVYPYVGGVAMNNNQRKSLGLSWGDQIYIEGLGTYTLFDTGCRWGVVDVFCNTVSECYTLTSDRNVYIIN